ncbi:MmgE/PrpD family protein [Defluviimonas salinarum]|uniref:MmgE/PrpD family protein n=1 Tax=Defluviimonas salinarum TaxID=2992147 RepID=A0ABT3J7M2_9RHOB|nr:MmgE/PrpD family protein [Defluviimonas salinarum]MCW3783683.1 MmgE/PrpD family protein [Defluviimonas salinarum]
MTRDMAGFAVTLGYGDLPEALLALLRRSFLDTMGVAAIGSTTGLSRIARKGALALFGPGEAGAARMLMDGRRVSPAGAAMAGAFMVDSIDAHDGTTPNKGHAGSAIFPALLAVADAERARGRAITGRDFALWLALAYEISYRAGQVQHATCPDYHTSGAWTAVGVAAAAARMLGCDREQIRHAAGIGEYHGPRSQMMRCIDFPTMVRDGVGWGAPSGVTAAYLAREGFTGAPALTCEGAAAEPFWQGLGESWLTLDHTHYKAYPCCRWAHPSIDAARDLMRENGLTHDRIAGVEIRTFHYATRLAGHEPKSLDEFSYAIAFPVAAMIVRGRIGVGELTEETLRDPEILRISRATTLIDDPELTARSVAQRWAAVTLITTDGRRFEAPPRTPRGDTDQPLGDDEIRAKFHGFADPVLGAERAAEMERLASRFDTLGADGFAALSDLVLTRTEA